MTKFFQRRGQFFCVKRRNFTARQNFKARRRAFHLRVDCLVESFYLAREIKNFLVGLSNGRRRIFFRLKNFVTNRAQNQLRKFNVVFKLAPLFLRDIAGRRVVAVADFVTRRLNRHVAEFIFKPTDFRRAERVIRRRENDCLRPKIFVMLAQAVENAFAVLATARLPYINLRRAEQKINASIFQLVALLALVQVLARDFENNSGAPVNRAFDSPARRAVNQK